MPLFIAHRGESLVAPENTLAAFNLAWTRGARAIECDVRLTRDGKLAVIHDATTKRIGGPNLAVRSQTLAVLKRLDAGTWKSRKWTGERIPSIDEVLETVPAHGRIFIELKEGPECIPRLVRSIERSGLRLSQILVMSFDEFSVRDAVAALPRCEHCLITTARVWRAKGGLRRLVARAHELGCGALNLEIHRLLNREVVATIHENQLNTYTWTVNHRSTARRLVATGIDGITTDRCAYLSDGVRGV
jgi:glycerophosphoryl diester phosphodiesterase